jgi:hypothetical protein
MKRLIVCFFWFLTFSQFLEAQPKDSTKVSHDLLKYPFILEDSPPRLFTMRQFNVDFLSGYRLTSTMLRKNFKPWLSFATQAAVELFFFGPLTHEEGHRSILVQQNIGSISQPFFLSKRGGYIEGVTDATLEKLRNTNFPVFVRLYTAGLESDYLLTHREESLLAFNEDTYKTLRIDYIFRKVLMMHYYLIVFIKYDVDGKEETNELKRDIVGNDVYGQARHLFRPDMTFSRYTQYKDLTGEEINYVKKMGYRSLFNLVNLNLIGISNVGITENLRMNVGMGHALCPFGDFTD